MTGGARARARAMLVVRFVMEHFPHVRERTPDTPLGCIYFAAMEQKISCDADGFRG